MKKFTTQVITGKVQDAQLAFQKKSFNIITAIDVIEHFEDPVNDISIILSMLSPGGIFVIQTLDIYREQAKIEKEKWGTLKPSEHLHLFDADNLKTLAKQIGFADIRFYPCFEEADGNFVATLKV